MSGRSLLARTGTFLLCALLLPATAGAAAGKVEGLRMPAWLERDGLRRPVTPGMILEGGDRLLTGQRARLLLRLEEGSHVKLGERAEFHLQRLDPPPESAGAFRGFLDVLKGAFRFTTTALSNRRRRDLGIRIAGITAGIRGTDVWGKAAPDRDIVCLIEGAISVQRGAEAPFQMSDPLSFYIVPKNAPPLPVAPVDPAQLARWALETEIGEGEGALREGGTVTVFLKSYRAADLAGEESTRLRAAGYPVEVVEASVGGQTWHRLGVTGFASVGEARAFARAIDGELGVDGAWVSGG